MFNRILELCLTSNLVCKTVPSYQDHHLKVFLEHGIPFSICVSYFCITNNSAVDYLIFLWYEFMLKTDDKGVFSTSLSQEYLIVSRTFNFTLSTVITLYFIFCNSFAIQLTYHLNIFRFTDVELFLEIAWLHVCCPKRKRRFEENLERVGT